MRFLFSTSFVCVPAGECVICSACICQCDSRGFSTVTCRISFGVCSAVKYVCNSVLISCPFCIKYNISDRAFYYLSFLFSTSFVCVPAGECVTCPACICQCDSFVFCIVAYGIIAVICSVVKYVCNGIRN